MCREVVHYHHVALRQRRHKELLDVGAEGIAGHRSIEHERRGDASAAKAGNESRRSLMPEWRGIEQALDSRPPAIAADHLGGRHGIEIGRATCGARVWSYVESQGMGGLIK